MKRHAPRPPKPLVPATIPLPEHERLPNGCMFVRLDSLDALRTFWQAHRTEMPYAVEGWHTDESTQLLGKGEWVFGPDKASVVATVCRWGQSRMHVAWRHGMGITTGRWILKGLPPGEHHDLWAGVYFEDIIDPDLSIEDVVRELQERAFYMWSTPEFYGVSAYEPNELDCFIRDVEQEQGQAIGLPSSPF